MLAKSEVSWAFRYLFGREPETTATIKAHSHFANWQDLRMALLDSDEFRGVISHLNFGKKWVMTEVMAGSRNMWLDLSDRYVSQACLYDNYELEESNFVRSHLKKGDHFIDIGANLGWFTLLASTIVGTSGQIHAFEPRSSTFEYLTRWIHDSKISEFVSLYNCGVSFENKEAFINSSINTDNPGGSFVTTFKLEGDIQSEPIKLVQLDRLDIKKVNFIKIDVEGSELLALKGAQNLIKKNMPIIMSEINPEALASVSKCSANEYIQWLIECGYRVQIIDQDRGGEEILQYPSDWPRDILNVAAIPIDRNDL